LLRTTTISEVFNTNTTTSAAYTFDFSTGSTFYLTAPHSGNFTSTITNVPSDINRTYVITLIINSTTNRTYSTSVIINSGNSIAPFFANGTPTIPTTAKYLTQSISIQRISLGDNTGNVIILSSVVPWYQ
jgi:hypothetical protein